MSWRSDALQDIKRDEKCRLESYQDGEGVWTIGWGHTAEVGPGQVCTQVQADLWLEQDFSIAEEALNFHAPWWRASPGSVRRGLVNMSFNLGWPRLSRFVHMLRALWNLEYEKAATEALNSKWDQQVGQRADRVAALFREAAAGQQARVNLNGAA